MGLNRQLLLLGLRNGGFFEPGFVWRHKLGCLVCDQGKTLVWAERWRVKTPSGGCQTGPGLPWLLWGKAPLRS